MSLTINTNIQALNAQRNLSHTEESVAMSMEHLSSGLKINSAADDVAGYAINERLQSQINGLGQAKQNSQDAVALAQTAQGALNEVSQMLQRVRELAVQYENGTNSASDKEAIEGEVGQLNSEIKRVGETTSFNGIALLSTNRRNQLPGRRERRCFGKNRSRHDRTRRRCRKTSNRPKKKSSQSSNRRTRSSRPRPPVNSVRCRTVIQYTASRTWPSTAQNLTSAKCSDRRRRTWRPK